MMDTIANRVAARYKQKKKVESEKGGETTVYVYSERQIARRNAEKAKRLETLRSSIGKLRSKVKRDLRSSDPEKCLTSLAVALIDHTYERVGNPTSAEERGHVGVTGWQKSHISFGKGQASIKYTGKSGVKQLKKVTDAGILKALRNAYEAASDDDSYLFHHEAGKVTAEKVNAYLEPFGVSAKDLRGFHANREMQERLQGIRAKGKKLSGDKKERAKQLKSEFLKALDETAEAVGHEASTLRSQYLVPGLEEEYLKNGTVMSKMLKDASVFVYDDGQDAYVDTETGEAQPNGPADHGMVWRTASLRVAARYAMELKKHTIELELSTSDALKAILKVLHFFKTIGNWGASRGLKVEDDSEWGTIAGFDGDGADKIGDVYLDGEKVEFEEEDLPLRKNQLAKYWGSEQLWGEFAKSPRPDVGRGCIFLAGTTDPTGDWRSSLVDGLVKAGIPRKFIYEPKDSDTDTKAMNNAYVRVFHLGNGNLGDPLKLGQAVQKSLDRANGAMTVIHFGTDSFDRRDPASAMVLDKLVEFRHKVSEECRDAFIPSKYGDSWIEETAEFIAKVYRNIPEA